MRLPVTLWRLPAGQLLRAHTWDQETVLYNDLSGDTHLLAPEALFILRTLQAGPASRAALADALAAWLDDESEGDNEIDELLEHLSMLYLVEAFS
jgi:PqqD family protein of HPr-rel-A system